MQRFPAINSQDGMNPDECPISAGNQEKSPTIQQLPGSDNKRDSGYGTDVNYSPASQTSGTSAPRQFTYEIHEEFEEMHIEENEVFIDSSESGNMNQDILRVEDDDGDDTDKEVEDLLSDSVEVNHTVSQPINIQRPQAPIPTPEEDKDEDTTVKFTIGENFDGQISRPFHHTQWSRQDRQRNRFRPIASRSFGTQTPPSPNGIGSLPSRVSVRPTRGRGLSRLRLRSESEMTDGPSPLPDVIPFPRDRSVSLPEVPSYSRAQEREVGRELRRISDEFLSSFTPIRQRNGQSSSFPMRVTIDVQAYWTRIRRYVSSSSITPEADDQPFKFPPTK